MSSNARQGVLALGLLLAGCGDEVNRADPGHDPGLMCPGSRAYEVGWNEQTPFGHSAADAIGRMHELSCPLVLERYGSAPERIELVTVPAGTPPRFREGGSECQSSLSIDVEIYVSTERRTLEAVAFGTLGIGKGGGASVIASWEQEDTKGTLLDELDDKRASDRLGMLLFYRGESAFALLERLHGGRRYELTGLGEIQAAPPSEGSPPDPACAWE